MGELPYPAFVDPLDGDRVEVVELLPPHFPGHHEIGVLEET